MVVTPAQRLEFDSTLGPADSVRILEQLSVAADEFVRFWRYLWEVSDRYRFLAGNDFPIASGVGVQTMGTIARMTWPPPPGEDTVTLSPEDSLALWANPPRPIAASAVPRTSLVHCHPEAGAASQYTRISAYIIESGIGRRAVCPSWFPANAAPPWDERTGIDGSLLEPLRAMARERRAKLITVLERSRSILPRNHWITGQLFRFSLDQADTARAERITRECQSLPWWCTALEGYLLQARGAVVLADSTFQRMLARMPEHVRCNWTDLSALIEVSGRQEYSSFSCIRRDTINARLWWLADPVYSEAGNDRRAEHYARRVLLELRLGTSIHERWDMRPPGGGEAVRQMILRYGWPSFSFWAGVSTDRSHFGYLGLADDIDMYTHGRFATAEYTGPRFGVLPSWDAIRNPLQSNDYDWAISEEAYRSIQPHDTIYWPTEHYERRAGPLVQLWNQHGMFRRQDSVLLALATRLLREDFIGAGGDTLWGFFIVGHRPDSMTAEVAGGAVGSTSIVRSMVASRSQLVSLELHGRRPRGVVARTRFGIQPPPPLAEMKPRELGISAPVFIRPTDPGDLSPDDPARALSRMYGTVVFRMPERLGLYWETYGVGAMDSVEHKIQVVRHEEPPGFVRRIGIALGIGRRPTSPGAITWSEEPPRRTMQVDAGDIPIQGRVVTLNVSELGPGDYTLTMSVARPGEPPVTSTRDFWVVR